MFLKDYRLTKPSRAEFGSQNAFFSDVIPAPMVAHDLNSSQNLNSVIDTMGILGVQSMIDCASFTDKHMNKVNLVKNIGIDVHSLDTNYDELNDDEDVMISRGDRGPNI
ncbi:unnamed protein product [Prunus armeniaca]